MLRVDPLEIAPTNPVGAIFFVIFQLNSLC